MNPKSLISNFEKEDDEKVRALKIDYLHQSESLAKKLTQRRRIKGMIHHHGKRMPLIGHEMDKAALSRSFFTKEMEDTLATDSMFNIDQVHSFNLGGTDDGDFKEIFKVLDELEDDSKDEFKPSDAMNSIFGSMTPIKQGGISQDDLLKKQKALEKERISEFERQKSEAISEIKKTYDDEIKKLKKQGKNPMIKNMVKNVKKEREEAVQRVVEKYDSQKDEFLNQLNATN